MKTAFALVLASLGLAIGLFAAHVAVVGAEPPVPASSALYDGELLPGPLTRGPVGEPFLYGEIRVQDADDTEVNQGTIHWRGPFGNPNVRIRTASGVRAVHLPAPGLWHELDDAVESMQVATLESQPLLANVELGDRIAPPFRVSALVLRPGDHVLVARDPGARIPLYIGTRAEHVALRARREPGRWPMVAVLGLMSVVSFFAARRTLSGTFFADVPDDEVDPAT